MKSWYTIRARSSGTEVLIYDEIGAYGVTAKGFLAELGALPDDAAIDLRLNSPGGSVFDAVAIYNALKRHAGEITVWIDGIAASAASYIAMAGDTIIMPENAFLMIHDPSGLVMGTAEDMRSTAEALDKVKGSLIQGYAAKSGKVDDEIADLMGPDLAGEVGIWLKAAQDRTRTHGPLAGCGTVLRAVLDADDRAERVACMLSDIVLAQALNWKAVLPVTAQRLTKGMLRDLTTRGQGAELAIQARILESVEETIRMARDLAHRAEALRTVASKLRAKGSDAAVGLFLTEDAVAPASMLSPRIRGTSIPMTDRAARRFCDRLVELGVARELTGRPTFRLYGIAS